MTPTRRRRRDATPRGSLPRRQEGELFLRLVAQFDPESVGHSVQRATINAQDICRAGAVAADGLQHVFEVAALQLFERREVFEQAGRRIPTDALQRTRDIVGTTTEPRLNSTMRSMVFSRWRTLPV